jgi:flagellar basal-body rod modification protein FlgD
MTTPLSQVGLGTSAPTPISQALGSVAANTTDKTKMDKDMFLKLLVAQLKYQDPTKPADATAFLSQTAQFTQVEKLDNVSSSLQSMVISQQILQASGLVGRTVTYAGTDGTDVTGVVTSATFSGASPTLHVGDTDVLLTAVKQVRETHS